MHEEPEAFSEENRIASPHQSEQVNQIHKELQLFFDDLYAVTFSAKTNRFVLQLKAIKKIAAQLVKILYGNQQPPLIIQDHAELRKIILENTQSFLKKFYGPIDLKEDMIIIGLYATPHKTINSKPENTLKNFVKNIINALPEHQSYLKLIEQINACQSLINDLKQYEINLTKALKITKADINNKQQSLESIELYMGKTKTIRERYNKIFEITDQIKHFIDNTTRVLSESTSIELSKTLKKIIHTADKEIVGSCSKLSQALTVKLNDLKELSRFNYERRVKSLSRLMNEFNNLLSEELHQLENTTPDHDHSDSQPANSSEEELTSGISMPFMLFPPIESTAAMDADRKKFLELAQNDEVVTNSHSKRSLMLFPPAASDDSLKARMPLHKVTQKNRVDSKPPTHHALAPIQPTSNLYRK